MCVFKEEDAHANVSPDIIIIGELRLVNIDALQFNTAVKYILKCYEIYKEGIHILTLSLSLFQR